MRDLFVAALLALLLSSGCMNASELVSALSKDAASFCGSHTAWYGAGAVAIAPVPTFPAGGGYATLTFCRTNQANSIIIRNEDGSMRIVHGWEGRLEPGVTPGSAPAGQGKPLVVTP